MFLTLGCHPHFADKLDDAGIDQLRILVGSLKRRVVAIGECGLDISHKNEVPLDVQKRVFGAQVQLALDLNMPLVLHILKLCTCKAIVVMCLCKCISTKPGLNMIMFKHMETSM